MHISIDNGQATLPDGRVVDLLKIQATLNNAFQETGDEDFMEAADQLSLITQQHQSLHGEFVPGSYEEEQA